MVKYISLITLFFVLSCCSNKNRNEYEVSNYIKLSDTLCFGRYDKYSDGFVNKYDTSLFMLQFYWNDSSLMARRFFKNGVKNGPDVVFGKNGEPWYRGMYVNGKKNGIQIEYKENGDSVIEEYKNGVGIK